MTSICCTKCVLLVSHLSLMTSNLERWRKSLLYITSVFGLSTCLLCCEMPILQVNKVYTEWPQVGMRRYWCVVWRTNSRVWVQTQTFNLVQKLKQEKWIFYRRQSFEETPKTKTRVQFVTAIIFLMYSYDNSNPFVLPMLMILNFALGCPTHLLVFNCKQNYQCLCKALLWC